MRPLALLIAPVCVAFFSQGMNAQPAHPPPIDTFRQDQEFGKQLRQLWDDSLTSWIAQERNLLAGFHMIPIIVPKGERVGDSYDPDTSVLIAGAGDCFPKLLIRKDPGQLPSMTTYSQKGLAAALGAAGVVDAEGSGQRIRAYALSFRDVEVQTASVVQLRNALPRKGPQECEALRPYLQALSSSRATPSSQTTDTAGKGALKRVATVSSDNSHALNPPIVIGTVYYARRILRVSASDQRDAQAKLSFGQELLRRIGLESSFKLEAGGLQAASNDIEFVGNSVVPVAYTPAFEVTTTKVAGDKTMVQIAETNPAAIRQQVAAVESLLTRSGLVAARAPSSLEAIFENNAIAGGFLLGTGNALR